MIRNNLLCMPIVDEIGGTIFVPDGFRLSEIETGRVSYLSFRRSSEGVWETLTMSFYTKDFKVIVYHIEYTKEVVEKDLSHAFYTQEFATFDQLKNFFRVELAKAG